MPSAVRALVLVFCLLPFAVTGCGGSNNKGKIEGPWKFVSVGDHPNGKQLRDATIGFDGDGVVTLHLAGEPKPSFWRYKLLAGDAADFYAFTPDAAERGGLFPVAHSSIRVTIRIDVDTSSKYERRDMTLTDPDGRELKLTRIR